jgi:basic membrane protein A
MNCPQCGHLNKLDAAFCAQCGAPLSPSTAATPPPPPIAVTQKKGSSSTWIIVVVVIAALLVLLCCCCIVAGGGFALVSQPTGVKPVPTKAVVPAPTRAVAPTAAPQVRFRVGLVTDVGKVDDKSFNESAWNALKQAEKELGAEIAYIETTDPKDYGKNIATFADKGFNVIVTSGFGLGEATAAAAKKYPNVKFIGTDQFQSETVPNLAGLIFEEDKAGFLAGALAAYMSQTGVVGAVLGTDVVPPVVKFGKGYENGAKFANPTVKVILAYHPGGLAKGFVDPEWGKQTAVQQIDQKADVIFGAGGKTGNGALIAAAEKKVFCIGVDTDQWYTVPEAKQFMLSSAMKLITPGTFDLIKAAKNGTFKGGNITGPVGLAPFHDTESQIPDAVKARLQEIDKGLKDGSIQTGVKL